MRGAPRYRRRGAGREKKGKCPKTRGLADGRDEGRKAESAVRRAAVVFLQDGPVALPEGGDLLGVAAATLRGWKRREMTGSLGPNPLGRPPHGRDPRTLEQVRELVGAAGAEVSVAYVRDRMPWVPRAVVEETVKSYKRQLRRERRAALASLRWRGAGRVWSSDWTEPGCPVEGKYGKVLSVRDLPSGESLQALPTEANTGWVAAAALESLFEENGAPLVVKNDGGSELNGAEVEAVLEKHGVAHLCSPGYYPRYNGSIEAGIGSLKTHAWYEAARHGRPGHWTCDDLEAARLKANETSRPRGPHGPSPDALWAARTRITRAERARFQKALAEERRRPSGAASPPKNKRERQADERHAIERALQKCGYLTVVRGRVPPGVT